MNRKVQAGGLAGAITVVIVWVVGLLGVDVPPEVASAVTTIIAVAIAWLVPETKAPPAN